MKKYLLAAAIATAPMLAATSADAITVPEGSELQITIRGVYTKVGDGSIEVGSQVSLGSPNVSLIDFNGVNSSSFDGVTVGSGVTTSGGPLTLVTGNANNGLTFTFNQGSIFEITNSVFASVSSSGPGASGVAGFGTLDADDGSFSYATSTNNNFGEYQLTVAVPPTVISPVPLPAAAWMLLAGLGSLWAFRRRTHA